MPSHCTCLIVPDFISFRKGGLVHFFYCAAMKKIISLLVLLAACAPATMITGTWKNTQAPSGNYHNILVAALTSRAVAKNTVEEDLVTMLKNYHVTASKSIDLFPPNFTNSDSNRTVLLDKIKGGNFDAILTVSLLKRETESRYAGSPAPYDPFRYSYYRNFWGYYSYWYPTMYDPAYDTETVYYIETNLYDASSEELKWSAQSKTYDILNLATFSKEFSKSIVDQMIKDGVLQGETDVPPETPRGE
jgi:hypothetical protein